MKKSIQVLVALALMSITSAPVLADTVKDLPKGVIKSSGVVPKMGEHWSDPKTRPWGPVYGVMDGKIVFYEFEVLAKDLAGSKKWERELPFPKSMPGIDHIHINYMPKGHRNMEVPHFAFHAYMVSHEVHMKYLPKKRKKKK